LIGACFGEVGDFEGVFDERSEIPMEMSGCHDGASLADDGDLLEDFAWAAIFADAIHGHAGPDVAVLAVLTEPPVIVGGEREFGGFDRPVELRDHVVQPAVLQPFEGVGREFFIGVEASAGAGRNVGAPEAKGTDTKLDPFLGGFDAIVEFVNEGVDVLPAPMAFVEGATRGLIRFV